MDTPGNKRFLFGRYGPIRSRKARLTGILLLVLFVIYSVSGFFILPYYARKIATETLTTQLGRTVTIDSIRFNPYTLAVAINNFKIKEEDGQTPFVSFDRLYVNLEIISLLKGGPVIREIKLEKPYVSFVRTAANAFNFSTIAERFASKPAERSHEKPGKPFLFSINNIQLVNGSITFDDRPAAIKHEIARINLSVPFISNLPSHVDTFVQPMLSASINGTPLNIGGASKVFADSRETSLDITLKDIDIPYYLAYAPAALKVNVPSGRLDVLMKVSYREYTNRAPTVVLAGETRIRDLKVMTKKPQEDLLRVPLLSIKDISADLQARKIEVGSVLTQKGLLSVARGADGKMNFDSLMETPQPASSPTVSASAPGANPWILSLKSLVVDDYTLKVADHVPAEPFGVTIDKINCGIQGLSTEKNTRGTLAFSMRLDHAGSVSIKGDIALDPVFADLDLILKDLRFKPLQPYVTEKARVMLAAGTLSMNGHIIARRTEQEKVDASVKGKLRIGKFALLDKANAEDLLTFDSFSLDGIDVRTNPLSVHVRDITLSNFYSRIAISADRKLNLQEIMSAPATTADAAGPVRETPGETASVPERSQPEAPQPEIRIDTITLDKGTINFTDNSIQPRFSSNLVDIKGRVTGLSSALDTAGEVELSGKYDGYAPLTITGKVNPIRKDLYVDLKSDFKDMDLTTVSPYAGRYAGYTIEKGKFSFRLEYLVEKNKLNAKNNIFIDQFTFGDSVESAEATELPVKLAVALLKDRNGEISLDIPVSGELNDPQFSIGGTILKVIVNLLVKAATAPFALIGAMFGGGEQMDYAEFDYGSSTLTEGSKKKLDILEKALNERPVLKMDIIGHVDIEKDREGLKQYLLLRRVKAQKISDLANKSDAPESLEATIVTPQEYPGYLKRAYKAEKFPKPRNAIGMAIDLPVPEMEKLMLANLAVTDDDLKALAAERVKSVRGYLLQSKRVEPERIFTIEPKALAGDKKEGAKDSRTDFKLK